MGATYGLVTLQLMGILIPEGSFAAVRLKDTDTVGLDAEGITYLSAGHVTIGGESSYTVSGKVQDVVRRARSSAVQVTCVVVSTTKRSLCFGQSMERIPEASVAVIALSNATDGSRLWSERSVV
jgi:hypothetical protein